MCRLLFLLGALGTLQAATVSIEIARPGNIHATPPNVIAQGSYVGPYTLEVNGVKLLGLCVDFSHDSDVRSAWTAFQTPVTSTGMNNTYVYQENASKRNVAAITLRTYEEEVYLYLQIVNSLLPGDRIAIQEAAWSITDPGFNISDNQEAKRWAAAAKDPTNYLHVDLAGIVVYSDVNGISGGNQEFIGDQAPVSVAPEPVKLGLVAGLLGVACIALRRRR